MTCPKGEAPGTQDLLLDTGQTPGGYGGITHTRGGAREPGEESALEMHPRKPSGSSWGRQRARLRPAPLGRATLSPGAQVGCPWQRAPLS